MLARFFQWLGRSPLRWHAVLAALFVAALAVEVFGLGFFHPTELRLTDMFMRRQAASMQPDPEIVVVDIDNRSMALMQEVAGLWAWPRDVHGDLLNGLMEFAPKAVVFDMAFTERDTKRLKSDAFLSDAIHAFPKVYLAATYIPQSSAEPPFPISDLASAFAIKVKGNPKAQAVMQLPLAIAPQVWRLGLINSLKDADGVMRRYGLYTNVQGWRLPSMPARVVSDLGVAVPAATDFVMRWPQAVHKHFSYGELYLALTQDRSKLGPNEVQALHTLLRDKIIVIGSSATSAFDHLATPLTADAPGVDILATAIDNLKNQRAIHIAPPAWMLTLGTLLIGLVAFAFARRLNPVMIGAVLSLLSIAVLIAADLALARNLLLPIATPLIFAWAWFLFAAIAGYLRERRSREKAVSLFGRFLNPVVVGRMVDMGETVESLSGRHCEMTVLFSDIRGFTTMSETRPAQEVVALLNRYFERQVEVVFRHGGTLDKFIGDCIMAFWGAPVDDPAHAKRAVAAALEMQETLLAFKQELAAEGADMEDFDVGIGVHSGPAVVGFIGAQKKLDYTAIGDTVNLASRVEGLTKGVARVLVTRETMLACQGDARFHFLSRGAFHVKGRAAEVELFEPFQGQEESR